MADKKEANAENENTEVVQDGEKKAKKGGLPILSLIAILLSVGTLFIAVLTFTKVNNIVAVLDEMNDDSPDPKELGLIPLDQIETFSFKEKFILTVKDANGENHNVLFEMSFGALKNDDTAEDITKITADFENKQRIVRDGTESLLLKKKFEDYSEENIQGIKDEVIQYLRERFGTNAIVEVYLNGIMFR